MNDLPTLIKAIGTFGVCALVFAESGLFFGFFLPGDSLVFTAGLLASQGYFSFPVLLVGVIFCAIAGDSVGYAFGKKVGPLFFTKEDSFFFRKKHIESAAQFFQKHGAQSIVLARFVPAVRTFTPIFAGIGEMNYKTFLGWNVFGGILWGGGLTILGYVLGASIPDIDHYLVPIVLLIVLVSLLPVLFSYFKKQS